MPWNPKGIRYAQEVDPRLPFFPPPKWVFFPAARVRVRLYDGEPNAPELGKRWESGAFPLAEALVRLHREMPGVFWDYFRDFVELDVDPTPGKSLPGAEHGP